MHNVMRKHESLSATLTEVRRRLLAIGLGAGLGWAAVGAVLFLLLWMWLDLALELTPGLRLVADVGAVVVGGAIVLIAAGWSLRMGNPLALARRLDAIAGTRGQILTGVDLMGEGRGARGEGRGMRGEGRGMGSDGRGAVAVLSPGLRALAIERASELAGKVSRGLAVPARPLAWPVVGLAVLFGGIGILGVMAPRLVGTQWKRFVDPYGDHPPYSRIWFEVEPGNVRVVYGGGLDVRAQALGGVLEKVDLVLLPADGSRQEVLPMFPEPNGVWRAAVANVTAPGKYLVRAGRARSRHFDIGILTVPRFEQVTFKITPPAYTRQSAYEGPLPQGGLAGLPRTMVQVRVRSNRPLAGGVIEGSGFGIQERDEGRGWRGEGGGARVEGRGGAAPSFAAIRPARVEMRPGLDPREAVGTFVIDGEGQARIHLTDIDHQQSTDAFTFPITLLADERPFIRIMEPPPESLATPDAILPVMLSAEDDYGITRVRLYRSLNDSRPLPTDVAIPQPAPARWAGESNLSLGEYGVEPGDVIKVFARAEDNDPDGAKGAESTVATIRIISQQDYERMITTREGLEVMRAKYEMANRELEALLEEIRKLREEIENQPPESPLSEEQRQKLDELSERFEQAARETAKMARQKLPYDLDKKLSPQLEKLAQQMREAGEQARKMSRMKNMTVAGMEQELRKLAEKAGEQRRELQKEATEPMEYLASIYPLMEDQALFVAIYQRQRDLAQRMAALKGKDSGDDPELKARMRDLELEQRQVREALEALLDAVEEHAAGLPDDERLSDLKQTAEDFARKVRESAVTDVQASAETGLAEFSGTRAAEKSKEAADILESFLSRCKGMGDKGGTCLKFSPQLDANLGNTIDQLLAEAGLPSMGNQSGVGSGGGYSMQRSSLQNIGLYGHLPTMRMATESGQEGRNARLSRPGNRPGVRHEANPLTTDPGAADRAVSAAGVDVPLQYRQKVGRYFERIADEIGEESAKRGRFAR